MNACVVVRGRNGILLKLVLVGAGLVSGLLGAELTLRLLKHSPRGSEFESLAEVRAAMLRDSSGGASVETAEDIHAGNLRTLINPHPDDKIIFDLRPNLDLTFQRVRVKTNSCGMRSPERPVPKRPGVFRIALLGDSFTFGWGVEQRETFAQRLEDNLNRITSGTPPVEVLNFGVPGYSTFQEVAKFEEIGLDFNPDAVLVFFVQNDFGLPFYVRDINRQGGMLAATEFARLSWKMIDPKIEEQRLQLLGFDANSALKELARVCRKRGMPLLFTINPRKDWSRDIERLPVLRKRGDIRVLELRPDFEFLVQSRGIEEKALTLPYDPHPSALRHALYGDIMTPHFMDLIRQEHDA